MFESDGRHHIDVLQQANAADGGGGQDCRAAARRLGFVVERDVARHDGEVERAAGVAHAFQAAGELGHDFRPLRIGEVQAVSDGKRRRADG